MRTRGPAGVSPGNRRIQSTPRESAAAPVPAGARSGYVACARDSDVLGPAPVSRPAHAPVAEVRGQPAEGGASARRGTEQLQRHVADAGARVRTAGWHRLPGDWPARWD